MPKAPPKVAITQPTPETKSSTKVLLNPKFYPKVNYNAESWITRFKIVLQSNIVDEYFQNAEVAEAKISAQLLAEKKKSLEEKKFELESLEDDITEAKDVKSDLQADLQSTMDKAEKKKLKLKILQQNKNLIDLSAKKDIEEAVIKQLKKEVNNIRVFV